MRKEPFYRGFKKVENALNNDFKTREENLITLLRSDTSGVNTGTLTQVASNS